MLKQRHARRVATTTIAFAILSVVSFLTPGKAEAIPAWARKYGIECEACHTAWPSLNAYGRDFKINGYKIPGETDIPEEYNDMISDFLAMDKAFPIAGHFKMRPYDKKNGKRARIRAGHEVEVMIGGSVNQNFSVFTEFEAEDETDFAVAAAAVVASWNPRTEANVSMGYSNVLFNDPYDSLADGGRRMTVNHKGPMDVRGRANQRLRKNTQWAGGYGKISDRFFYMAGVSGGNGEPEGDDAIDFYGRVMVDLTPQVMAGGFVQDGSNDTGLDIAWDFTRYGFDAQVEMGDFKAYGMYMHLQDTPQVGVSTGSDGKFTQNVGYVEAMYMLRPEGLPMIVPLVRLDFLDGYTDLTADVQFYVVQNIKGTLEYWTNLDTPGTTPKNNRLIAQFDLVF